MMTMLRFAVLAAVLLLTPDARLLKIRRPTHADETKLKKPVADPLRLVDGGVSDGSPPVDITLVGQVDELRQQEEAEQGRPIEEDKVKVRSTKAVKNAKPQQKVIAAPTPAPLQKGMERADRSNQKASGRYNPLTDQVEAGAALIQTSRKSRAVDWGQAVDYQGLDEADKALVLDEDEVESYEDEEESEDTEEMNADIDEVRNAHGDEEEMENEGESESQEEDDESSDEEATDSEEEETTDESEEETTEEEETTDEAEEETTDAEEAEAADEELAEDADTMDDDAQEDAESYDAEEDAESDDSEDQEDSED